MVAAHPHDLRAAQKNGLKTAYVPAPSSSAQVRKRSHRTRRSTSSPPISSTWTEK
jgi:hypothetical protein